MLYNPRIFRAAALFSAVIASVAILIGALMAVYSWRFLSTAARADGKVIRLDERAGMYYPVYTFADAQGMNQTGYSRIGSSPPLYAMGDTIKVLYQPANPARTMVHDFWNMWGFPIGFGAFGAISLSGSLGGMLVIRRFARPS
jgi:hypothetical protein